MLFYILAIFGILLVVGGFIAVKLKKKKKVVIPIVKPKPVLPKEDISYPNVMVKSSDRQLYEKFISEYDNGELKFDNCGFRKGAKITCAFGISEGYKYINNRMVWGYVRLHTGVDRARGGEINGIKDVVQIPFNFNRSNLYEYKDKNGNYTGYGTLVQLFNDEYGFEMRIAHMDPIKDMVPWAYDRLRNHGSFKAGWLLGKAGTCGDSSGAHTHTEFLSTDDSCEVFDILLEEKYGDKSLVEYTKSEIIKEYKKYEHFTGASDRDILKDWEAVKAEREASFVNKYKYKFRYIGGQRLTRYASNLLFNGL